MEMAEVQQRSVMHRLWFERSLPPHLAGFVRGRAVAVDPEPLDDPLASAAEADGAIASSLIRYDAGAFDRMPRLRVVSRTGIGYDRVDVSEATRRGIAICTAPDAPTVSTAEHTVALMLAVAKRLDAAAAMLRRGPGDYFSNHGGVELAGRTLGVVGYGRIGARVAAMGSCLGMKVMVFDPEQHPHDPDIAIADTFDDLLGAADIVTLHVPLGEGTRHLLDERAFARMRPGAILVNTARGGLVDQEALLAALDSGHLRGAGLDVTDPEPLPPSHPLLDRENVVVTPHVASATIEGRDRLYEQAIRHALQVLDGGRPDSILNPEVLARSAEPTPGGVT
jgi:phosphoglycerate dehydrogenase-like enzyme